MTAKAEKVKDQLTHSDWADTQADVHSDSVTEGQASIADFITTGGVWATTIIDNAERERWSAVKVFQGEVAIVWHDGIPRIPPRGYALLRMIACSLCATDGRVINREKEPNVEQPVPITMGHEGVGQVVGVGGRGETRVKPGDIAVVLPHLYPDARTAHGPRAIGKGLTRHMGWDRDGVFATYVIVPTDNLVVVPVTSLHRAAAAAPGLPIGALFTLVEPMSCVCSGYLMIEQTSRQCFGQALTPGEALVMGRGPMGFQNCVNLLHHGWRVSITDVVPERAALLRSLLDNRVEILDTADHTARFDLVMVAASSAAAIQQGEILVRNNGWVYLFAGLNKADREAMDRDQVFYLERVHRQGKPIVTLSEHDGRDKVVRYLGHSGYWDTIAPMAISMVATYARELDRMVTGVIPGWSSPRIVARLPGARDWTTGDGSPALIQALRGRSDLLSSHIKLLVLSGDSETPYN